MCRSYLLNHSLSIKQLSQNHVGSIYTCYLLGVNYWLNYLLNNGLYCTKRVHSYLLFGQLLHGLKGTLMGCVAIFHNCMD